MDEGAIERSLFDRTIALAITRKPIALPNCECVPLMTESLSLYVPKTSKYASRQSVSWNDSEYGVWVDKSGDDKRTFR